MLIDVTEPGRLVALTGRLDVSSVADVRLALHAAVDDGTGDLFLDASAVESIDASGLGRARRCPPPGRAGRTPAGRRRRLDAGAAHAAPDQARPGAVPEPGRAGAGGRRLRRSRLSAQHQLLPPHRR